MIIYETKQHIPNTKLDKTLITQVRPHMWDTPWEFTQRRGLEAYELSGYPKTILEPRIISTRGSVCMLTKKHTRTKEFCAEAWLRYVHRLGHTYTERIKSKYKSELFEEYFGSDKSHPGIDNGIFHNDLITRYTLKRVKHAHIYVKSGCSGAVGGWVGYHQCYLDDDQLKEIRKFSKIKMRACDMYHEDMCYGWAWIETKAGGNYVPLHRLQSLVGVRRE